MVFTPKQNSFFFLFLPSVKKFSFKVKYRLLLSHSNIWNVCPDQSVVSNNNCVTEKHIAGMFSLVVLELPLCTDSLASHQSGDSADKLPAFIFLLEGGKMITRGKKKGLVRFFCNRVGIWDRDR